MTCRGVFSLTRRAVEGRLLSRFKVQIEKQQAMEKDAGFSNSLPEYFMLTEEEIEEFRLEKSVTTAKVTSSFGGY